MSFMTPPDDTPPQTAFIASMSASAEVENEDEWEYEYSTTEFETYYVTLDLTTPNVPPKRRARNPPDRRAGRWTNPGLGKQKRHTLPPPPTFSAQLPGSQQVAAAAPEKTADPEIAAEDNEDDEDSEPPAPEQSATAEAPATRPTKVQILDLHTPNPVVSYDGHVYSCQWAENVGTEMLFKTHDENDNTIPGIRTLPGGVDLIAMSTARIVSHSVQLKPVTEADVRTQKRAQGHMKGLKISVGNQALPKRKEQAAFLEKLIAIKEKKGEDDLVTIHTKARPKFKAWVQALKTKRARERQELTRIIENGDQGDDDLRIAEERIREIDAEVDRLQVELEARGLHPDGKRKAKEGDARKRGKTNQGGAVPKTIRGPAQKRRPRKVPLLREIDDLIEESVDTESLRGASDSDSADEDLDDSDSQGAERDEEGSEDNDEDEGEMYYEE